ncbi:MAG: hypothetical protein Q9N26_02140 [Aquificota bacterium]|nr:hypothetical protein [Aquificota bacterium]MDQ7081607.1 hypothetical protein [Aquificota bacterium]
MVILGLLLLFASFSAGGEITDKEYMEDLRFVNRIDRRLDELDREAMREGATVRIVDELNSYGYPLNNLKQKYMDYNEERYGKLYRMYRRVSDVYDKLMYVKRGVFPEILMREMKKIKAPVCRIWTTGKRRETLNIAVKDPNDEEAVLNILTKTQLQYAHLIGVETISFEKCR